MGKIDLLNDEKAGECPHTCPHQQKNPCNSLGYKDLCFFIVAGTGLEPATFGL